MFCYFRKFSGMSKLSNWKSYQMKTSLYSDNVLNLIDKRKDVNSLSYISDQITTHSGLVKYKKYFDYKKIKSSLPWIDSVFKAIINIEPIDWKSINSFRDE